MKQSKPKISVALVFYVLARMSGFEIWVYQARWNGFLTVFTYNFYCYGERELNGKRCGNMVKLKKWKYTSCHPEYNKLYRDKTKSFPHTAKEQWYDYTFFQTPLPHPQPSSISFFCTSLILYSKSCYYQMLVFYFRLTVVI